MGFETKVNRLVVSKRNYKTNEDFENAIKDAVMVLLKNSYTMVVRYDEPALGVVCIDYDYDAKLGFGNPLPYFLTDEEAEELYWNREKEEVK